MLIYVLVVLLVYLFIKQDTVVKWMCNLVYRTVDWLIQYSSDIRSTRANANIFVSGIIGIFVYRLQTWSGGTGYQYCPGSDGSRATRRKWVVTSPQSWVTQRVGQVTAPTTITSPAVTPHPPPPHPLMWRQPWPRYVRWLGRTTRVTTFCFAALATPSPASSQPRRCWIA